MLVILDFPITQAIIPREASRPILLGDASYTLIDDNGVEFYLSPSDKKKRESGGGGGEEEPEDEKDASKRNGKEDGDDEITAPKEERTMSDVLRSDPHYQSVRRNDDLMKEVCVLFGYIYRVCVSTPFFPPMGH